MQLVCGKCQRVLDFAGERPSFCAYCGQSLVETQSGATAEYDPKSARETDAASSETTPAARHQRVFMKACLPESGASID